MALLTDEQIREKHADLPVEWALLAGNTLGISLEFDDFASALAYVNKVGAIAEKLNHHPDIELGYGKVVLRVTTHSEGGLTKKDFEFANAIKEVEG